MEPQTRSMSLSSSSLTPHSKDRTMTKSVFEHRHPPRIGLRAHLRDPQGAADVAPPVPLQQPQLRPPAHLPRLSGEPPAPLGPASANFLMQPTGMAEALLDPFLTAQDRVSLARASLGLRYEIRSGAFYQESEQFAWAYKTYRRAVQQCAVAHARGAAPDRYAADVRLAAQAAYWQTCIDIAQARAGRGIPQPLLPALREARRLLRQGNDLAPAELLASERLLVDAADRTATRGEDPAGTLHANIWAFVTHGRNAEEAPVWAPTRFMTLGFVQNGLTCLAEGLAEAVTADLRPAADPLPPARPQRHVVFVDHVADASWTEGKLVQQSHVDWQGNTITKSLPWPGPDAGVTRLCFEFGRGPLEIRSYVHTFNVPHTDLA